MFKRRHACLVGAQTPPQRAKTSKNRTVFDRLTPFIHQKGRYKVAGSRAASFTGSLPALMARQQMQAASRTSHRLFWATRAQKHPFHSPGVISDTIWANQVARESGMVLSRLNIALFAARTGQTWLRGVILGPKMTLFCPVLTPVSVVPPPRPWVRTEWCRVSTGWSTPVY